MNQHPVPVVGIPWYQREAYTRLRRLFTDGDTLPETYDQWLKMARQVQINFERQRCTVVHALIDPRQFPQWCAENGLKPDAQARLEWAHHVARNASGKQQNAGRQQAHSGCGAVKSNARMQHSDCPQSAHH